jgi:predicted Fe-Mo cluster-binding NifX family protein
MRVAIPEFRGRVSPAFDFCRRIIVLEVQGEGPPETREVEWSAPDSDAQIDRLRKLKIEILLCGGISVRLARDIEEGGIKVFQGLSGDIKSVLSAFLSGELHNSGSIMPGCIKPKQLRKRNRHGRKM